MNERPPWFREPGRLAALYAAVADWMGTPWAPNSCARGPRGGVACHHLPAAIYRDAGWLPKAWLAPDGDPKGTRFGGPGVIQPWLDSRQEFVRVPPLPHELRPGDLLGFRFWRGVDHLGLAVGDGSNPLLPPSGVVHVLQHSRTTRVELSDPTWLGRLLVAWRPLELQGGVA